ncbi:MAG TPA: hypothetical protein VF656_06990 [Pyrinomonadaceae bacterium]|jgi:hypothetical protein
MVNIFTSAVTEANTSFCKKPRQANEDNLGWLERVMPPNDQNYAEIVLLGGSTLSAFRLRAAQAHLRHDLTPSSWSHVILLGSPKKKFADTVIHEISLEPRRGFGFPVPGNALQRTKLGDYSDATLYPNIAHIRVPVERERVTQALVRYQGQRAVLDGPQLLLLWLGYLWGVSSTNNPLAQGQGMPSAAMIEVVVGASGFDLTPGLESRSSCPEAIWQAAKWWHEYYEKDKGREALSGSYFNEHDFLINNPEPMDAQKLATA